jgi:hypothetical protein
MPRIAQRFCVKAEKPPKQYIKRQKSSFAEKILKLLYGPIFPHFMGKIFFFPLKRHQID